MKEKMDSFIHGLIIYDYILFGSVFILFILFIILSLLSKRKLGISIFFVLLSFSILLLGPTIGYMQMHRFLFKNSVELISQKKLTFVKAVVVKGIIKNESKFDFKSCKITAGAYQVTGNAMKDFIYQFKPLINMSILEENINKGESREFKIIIEPFTYEKDYNISMGAGCK